MADLTVSSDIDTFMASANFAAARTNLGLELGSDIQAYDAQLQDIAGLATTDGGFIVGNGSNFVLESGATARTSLGLGSIAVLSAPSGTVVGTSDSQTLTNKTIDGDNNTLSNLDIGNEVDWAAAADVADRSAAPASGDKLLLFEAGVGLRKIDWDDLPSGGGGGSFSLPYSDGDSVTGSDATTTFELTPTWNTTGAPTVIGVDVTDTASDAASLLMDLQVDGSTVESTDKSGNKVLAGNIRVDAGTAAAPSFAFDGDNDTGIYRSAANEVSIATAGVQQVAIDSSGILTLTGSRANVPTGFRFAVSGLPILGLTNTNRIGLNSGGSIAWTSSTTDPTAIATLELERDADDTLGLRRGTNAQTFNVYNTYTASDNFERLEIKWDANVAVIGTAAGASGGTARNLNLNIDGSPIVKLHAFGTTLNQKLLFTELTGNPIMQRTEAGVLRLNTATEGCSFELEEMTAPSAPATDRVRIYIEDNGSGKTRLMALFPTGAAQQIAIEP